MSADLQFWHPDHLGDAKGKLLYRYVNTLNTPITALTWLGNGAAIADVYELIFAKSGGTVTCTVDPLIAGSKNPYRDMVGKTVTADGATPNLTLVPGLSIVLSGSTDTGWKARASIGNYLETDGSCTPFFSYGIVEAGETSAEQRVAVKNVGADDAVNTVLYSLPGLHMSGGSYETLLAFVRPHSSPTRHKLAVAGSYAITFSDWKNGGSGKKTADIYVDGDLAVQDAEFDGATVYEHGSDNGYDDGADKLKGLQICLADVTDDPTAETITLTVRDGSTWVKYASDSSGTPGAFSHQDLTLTAAGQSTGMIPAGGAAFFWHRWDPPLATAPAALREMLPRLRALTI